MEDLDPKLRPFLAQLKRLEISRFTSHPEFEALIFENGFESWWEAVKFSRPSPLVLSTKTIMEHRESALWSLFQILYTKSPKAIIPLAVAILNGCMIWKPKAEPLLGAVDELKKLTLSDKRVLQLEDRVKNQIQDVKVKRSKPGLDKPVFPVGVSNKVFIVHGHAESDRLQLVKLLKDEMGLEPIVVQDEPNTTLESILTKIERLAEDCHAAVVLLTPDDDTATGKRPRQNVVLELGYFIGRWRESDVRRIVVLKKGDLEAPSDINGVLYLPYQKDPEELHLKLSKQFRSWGFKLKPSE